MSGEPFFDSQHKTVGLAAKYAVPTIYAWREYVRAGGLISYGTEIVPESYRQAAIYAGRILKGEKPANLPVVQPTKFYMAVNSKVAKSLGIEVPPRLLGLAETFVE